MGLDSINHIVVLLLENRSFDHMLGYLSLEGGRTDVDGLKAGMKNVWMGKDYPIRHLSDRTLPLDPCHEGPTCVDQQIAESCGGFVANFAKLNPPDPGVIMGYYSKNDVPVFDHLAEQFTICDRWFSSVAGPTIPNRMYAIAGRSGGRRVSPPNLPPPVYNMSTIFDYLNASAPPISWRVFAGKSEFSMLRVFQNYRFAGKQQIGELDDFFPIAAAGQLPSVTWLEPDYGILSSHENDDHPPTDIWNAQRLVGEIYNTLLTAAHEAWQRTLFIVTYDEHGGIYDHVSPANNPDIPTPNDDPADGNMTYGVRVPAFLISPWVKPRYVCKQVLDHTSILKTILSRFLRFPDGSVPHMHARVDAASGLNDLLSEQEARTDATAAPLPPILTPAATLPIVGSQALLSDQVAAPLGGPVGVQSLNDYQAVLKRIAEEVRAKQR
jgi:phospholipase C